MGHVRVWLTEWEWACCGDPFAVGDVVTLHVQRRPGAWVAEMLGPDLARTVDAEEMHHERPGPELLAGVVEAIHTVTIDHTERRQLRDPMPPPPEPVRVGTGAWAIVGSTDPYVTVSEPIPGTARLHDAPRVPWPLRDNEPGGDVPRPRAEPDAQGRVPRLNGYLVDLRTD